ncbi:hypothetical protein B566_EDAN008260 [Ephemera danica]|nr:hypothetical protein B566_EDAN008260 [Ephemera danica]
MPSRLYKRIMTWPAIYLANGYDNYFWTSGKYIDSEILWTSTGEIITYDNWGPNSPCNTSACGIGMNIICLTCLHQLLGLGV